MSANPDKLNTSWDKTIHGEKITKDNKKEFLDYKNTKILRTLKLVTVNDMKTFTKEETMIFLTYAKAKARYYSY